MNTVTQDSSCKITFNDSHMIVNINDALVRWDKSELIGSHKKGDCIRLKNKSGFNIDLTYENESILNVELKKLRSYRLRK